MKTYIYTLIIILFALLGLSNDAQSITIKYQINKPYCLLNFMETLKTNGYYGPSIWEYYQNSDLKNDKTFNELINQYKSIKTRYGYELKEYPKYRFLSRNKSTMDLLYILSTKANTLDEYQQLTSGILPFEQHQNLFETFKAVEPYYDQLIWEPYYDIAKQNLTKVKDHSRQIDLGSHLDKINHFFNNSFSKNTPFIVSFSIVPGSKIKLIPPPLGNAMFCGLLSDSDEFDSYLSKVAHEFAHRSFAEQSLETHLKIDNWMNQSNSPNRYMVNLMLNEVLGGALGHIVMDELIGEHEFSYGQKSVKSFDEAIYPLVMSYYNKSMTIDSLFIEKSMKAHEEAIPGFNKEFVHLLQTYYLVTDVDKQTVRQFTKQIRKKIASPMMYEKANTIIDDEIIDKMVDYDFAKMVVITRDHKKSLDFLMKKIPELKQYDKIDTNSEFIVSFYDSLGKAYIIMGLQSPDSFEKAIATLSRIKHITEQQSVHEII